MSSSLNRIKKNIIEAMQSVNNQGTSAYDSVAEVRRIEGDTAWVHIAGGVDETPVKLTIAAKAGDTVQVRVGGGRAWITGNATAPPTDDYIANIANANAGSASRIANQAVQTAETALDLAEGVNEHFWHNNTGAHITQVTQEEYEDDPTMAGGNLLMTSQGMAVRDGTTELATFTGTGAQVGKSSGGHSVVDANGMRGYGSADGTVQIFNLGYVEETNNQGACFSLGTRTTVRYDWNDVDPYSVGDLVKYNSSKYICIKDTSGSWDSTCWQLLPSEIGIDSAAIGGHNFASGYASIGEGANTRAVGAYSHSEGHESVALGSGSHAEGGETYAKGNNSHAEGGLTTASGANSHAGGTGTVADQSEQTAVGKYNTKNNTNNLFVVGNGTSDNARSDAFQVDKYGNTVAAGKLVAGGHPSGLYTEDVLIIDGLTVGHGANGYATTNKSVAKTGYTPIGIVGMHLTNASTGGTYNTFVFPHSWYLSNNTAYFIVRNTHASSDAVIKITATILYAKV